MSALRVRHIAGMTVLAGILAGAAMLAPIAIDAIRPVRLEQPPTPDLREINASRFRLEAYLVNLDKDPLAWNCRPGQPIRVRYIKDFCFAEHIMEFEAVSMDSAGSLLLTGRGEAGFISTDGNKLLGQLHLDVPQSSEIMSRLAEKLPRIPSHLDDWQMPMYRSAIEACLSGHSYIVIRNFQSDERFERLAEEFTSLAGVKLSRTTPATCM